MRYRTIDVDLNRQYRKDLNWNFQQIAEDIQSSDDISNENKQELLEELARVERESIERDDLLAGESLEALLQSIADAKNNANTAASNANLKAEYAQEQGDYAKTQGDYAKAQGDYAQLKGDYADEKAVEADAAAGKASTEASNLEQLKINVTQATQDANTSADTAKLKAEYAQEQGDYAKAQGDHADEKATEASTQASNAAQATDDAISATTAAQAVADSTRFIEEFDPATSYSLNNFVRFEGSSYISLANNNAGNTPDFNSDTEYWALAARRGQDGTGSVDSVNNKTGAVVLTASDVGAETPAGAKSKADTAEQNAKNYTDQQIEAIPETDLSGLATKQELEDHTETDIYQKEVHGMRYLEEKFEIFDGEDWVEIKGGGDEIQVAPISDLKATSSLNGNSIDLTWINPENPEYLRTEIYASATDITEAEMEFVQANADLIVNSDEETSYDYSTSHGQLTYFKAYAVHSLFGSDKYSKGLAVNCLAQDTEPPGPITNFSAAEDNEQISLSWTNPTDADFDKVKILYKTSGYPTSATDGTVAYEGSGTSIELNGLVNDTVYYFRAFTYDQVGNINNTSSGQQVTGEPSDAKIYGVRWNQTKDTYERLGDAAGQGRVFFDDVYPWSEMKRLNLTDARNVVAFHGDPTYKADGTNGQVMVQVSKFWYKIENYTSGSDNIYDFWIADNSIEGFKLHPGFMRNGEELPCFYFSAYEGNLSGGKLQSISGVGVTANRTLPQFRLDAQARGAGWEQQAFLQTSAIQLLYVVEYADFNSQTAIADGRVSQSSYANTGLSDSLGNASGGDATYMSYRGIENFWGNYYKWCDGVNFQDKKLFIADHDFESDKFSGNYEDAGISLPAANGFVKDIHHTANFDYGFMSKDSTGSDTTYIPDQQYTNYTGARVAHFGGNRGSGSVAGAFYWRFDYAASNSYAVIAARLLCFPEAG